MSNSGEQRKSTTGISSEHPDNAIRYAYNDHEGSLTVNGFIVHAVGRKVDILSGATTDQFTFSENGVTLYVLLLTYTDTTKATLLSAERTA